MRNINLKIKDGETVLLCGESGCGKTTLLRIIAGLEKLDSGSILVNGKEITTLEPSQRNLSMVFQSYALFPNMTVFENIEYGLKNKIKDKHERKNKIMEVLKMVGLDHITSKYPDEMSGGQQQRVSLARALALEPNILLLDEPLSALDAKVRESLRKEIREIQQKLKITTIMVTHDQEEALTMGDKIAIINGGEIVQFGTPEEIYSKPKDIFVADFIGKINFITDKNNDIYTIRPEDVEYFTDEKEETYKGIIKNIEFRGAFYRITLELFGDNIYIDILSKEKEKLNLKINDSLYIKLNEKNSI
ncbi:ABC transporter ATP-binding protein [Fusobacterium ulcerans]|uniref:ABC transporter ATP-binding protein n=1 Tax=Fusobacterium ulcerans TaxID=861 RepID=UPI0026ED43E8|nr:ATP-binding cassette domain-containing protein [Fusobacterium ulcerans]